MTPNGQRKRMDVYLSDLLGEEGQGVERVRVSDHAITKALQRIDGSDPYPAATLRAAFRKAVGDRAPASEPPSVELEAAASIPDGLTLKVERDGATATVVTAYVARGGDGPEVHFL